MTGSSSVLRLDEGHVPGVCHVSSREHEFDLLTIQPLGAVWSLPFQDYAPARPIRSYKGQRNFTGLSWCATNSRLVGYESWLERDHLMCLDFASEVVGIASQPFRLDFNLTGRSRWHVPDYFARLADGTGVVVDVRPDDRIDEQDQEVFSATASACASVGWIYRRVGALPRIFIANLHWMAGYKHPRCLNPAYARCIRERLKDDPDNLFRLAAGVGDPVAVLPTLFHLLWTGELSTDLHSRPLGEPSAISLKAAP